MNLSTNGKLLSVSSFTDNPNQPGLDPEYHRGRFVRQAVFGKILHYHASEGVLHHILNQLIDYFYLTAEDDEQFLREEMQIRTVVWPWLKPRLEHNKGLVEFMLQYGVYSRYFVPLLMCVPGALALCPAHGECLDIFGNPQKVPRWDKLYQFFRKDEMYAFARLRADDAKPALEKAESSMILGAGTLQEVRQLQRFSVEHLKKHDTPWIVAYDADVKLKAYYDALSVSLEEYGIQLFYQDFWNGLNNPENFDRFGLCGAWGVASYYDDELERLLFCMKRTLRPNGIIKFDMQILDAGSKFRKQFWQNTLVFDKVILRWESNMKPRKSITDARQYVGATCAKVGLKVDYCKYDQNNQIGAIFQCSLA